MGFCVRLRIGLVALLLCGCGPNIASPKIGQESPSGLPTSRAPTLRVAASPIPSSACMNTSMSGYLTENLNSGLGLVDDLGRPTAITWPPGYTASGSIGGSLLKDDVGDVVARTGDVIRLDGVLEDGHGGLLACGRIEVVASG